MILRAIYNATIGDPHTMAKGIVGTAAPILGVITSTMEHLEFWVRFSGLFVGLLVGVATLVSMVMKIRSQLRGDVHRKGGTR